MASSGTELHQILADNCTMRTSGAERRVQGRGGETRRHFGQSDHVERRKTSEGCDQHHTLTVLFD
ncbi:hypothetical protein RvY_05960 [Ramazzottius varieornatus]|uniref:Uncharacterized protein n=1 Tax=Ramazzottius varieornatus TaxID=947166 RepID=A0A1D1UXE0_RAMVA|nr:hypothetical protein RvY_05960 [Ramazzottius varieornatus]